MLDFLPEAFQGHDYAVFSYAVSFLPLSAGASESVDFTVQSDSHFLLYKANATARDNAAPATVVDPPAVTVRLEDTGSGRNLEGQALDWATIYGTAKRPGYFPVPHLLDPASQLSTTLTHLVAGGTDYDIRITYMGIKVFGWGKTR